MDEYSPLSGIVIVVCARLNARRLPGKALLPLGDSTVLAQVLARIDAAQTQATLVVAIPDSLDERPLHTWCEEHGLNCFAGDPHDPMARACEAARAHNADVVIPCSVSQIFLSPRMLWASARYACDTDMDAVIVARMATGTAVEALPMRTMDELRAMQPRQGSLLTANAPFASGVAMYPERFERALLPPPPRLARADLRLLLETPDDYRFVQDVYARCAPNAQGFPELDDVIACIDNDEALRRYAQGHQAVVRAA